MNLACSVTFSHFRNLLHITYIQNYVPAYLTIKRIAPSISCYFGLFILIIYPLYSHYSCCSLGIHGSVYRKEDTTCTLSCSLSHPYELLVLLNYIITMTSERTNTLPIARACARSLVSVYYCQTHPLTAKIVGLLQGSWLNLSSCYAHGFTVSRAYNLAFW